GYTAGNNLTTGSNNIIIGQAVAATAATSSNELNIGNVLFGNVDQTTATNRNIYVKSTNAAAFQVQNASGSEIFTVDSSANRVLFGKAGASGIDGKLVINNATNANTITIQTGVTSGTGYTLTLPTALGSSGDCLKDTNGSGVLGFASCTGATPTLQTGYTASTGGTTPEVKLDTTRTGFDIQDADTALTAGTALLSVRASSGAGLGTQLFSVDNSGATKISGGLTIGTVSTTSGSLAIANSLSAFKATIQSAQYAQDSTLTIPAAGATDTFCLQTLANCVGSLTLQQVYTASGATNPQILLGATGGALKIQDAASTVGTLFTVSSNGGGTTYLGVTTSGVNVSALNAGAGLIQTTGGLTATGSTSLNTTGTAATLIGNVSAPITMAASTLTATGALSFNTSGTAATLIGNVSAPVTIASSGINISSAGAISGATGYTQSSGNFAMSGSGTFATGTGAVNLNGATTITNANAAATSLTVNSGTTVPTADQVSISNASSTGVTTAGVNGLHVNYKGGAAAVESSGVIIDFAPGGTTGGTWSGLRIAANATGAAAGVTEYGIKLEGPTTPGSGTESAIYIGSGWDIGLDIQSGGLQMAAQNDPTTPTANNLRFYAKSIAGRVLPKWMGPSGVDTPVQANLGFNRISYMNPAGGTTLTTFVGGTGSLFTNTGTANNPTPASTNLLTSTRRATFSSGATAGTVASHRQSTLQVWRGNAANLGGFFYTIRFGAETLAAGNRAFVGLSDSTAAITNVDPITSTAPGKIGVAINANTGNWKWVNNVTGTAPTVVDLGASFPVNATDLYELIIYCPPNGSTITYRVTNLSTNSAGSAQVTGTATTNIPTNTTFLAPQFWITNNATAAAAMLAFGGWYLESDN
ncbi:hypothetical protein H7Y63_00115, partial [Polaromonas sp.]|nr:hypothetical protein [Candidatus Saccharibacteria bacterium]